MDITRLSRKGFLRTVGWGIIASLCIVGAAAGLGRATMNLQGALTDKPDLAVYLLLPDEEIYHLEMLKEEETERHYLIETKIGQKFVILKKGEKEWYVSSVENLHADATAPDGDTAEPKEETPPSQ